MTTLRRMAAAVRRWAPLGDWQHALRIAAAPGVILVLFAITVAISLGALLYAQHASSSIVEHDMRVVASLSDAAARFDHEDGELYRLMVDKAAGGRAVRTPERAAEIKTKLAAVGAQLQVIKPSLPPRDQARSAAVISSIQRYGEAVDVVASMLEVNFSASAAMLSPFRSNADQVISEVDAIVATGIADARRHAAVSAARTRWLVAVVAACMALLAILSVAWLAIASHRGQKLHAEVRLRQSAEANALLLARQDPLTDLANRRVFVGEMEALIRAGAPFAVALFDLDDFKTINDLYGHAAGDAVLRGVAERLRALSGPHALLARLGGDEFAAIYPGCASPDELRPLIAATSTELCRPQHWRDLRLHVGASVGASLFPHDAGAVDTLLHAADIAMYQAKSKGKGTFRFFDTTMEAARVERRRLEDELRLAIAREEIRPFYQPIVALADRRVSGYEILARWQHRRLGAVSPDQFIPLAEQTRQIGALTEVILRQACRDLKRLPPEMTIALNVSPNQLVEPDLAERLIGIIRDAGLPPARFEIEVTEDAVMDDLEMVELAIDTFRANGIAVALDDFGTGFSSLSNLHRLQFDKIKIDRSFVQTLDASGESVKIVDTVLGLARSFGMTVTAEGVETAEAAQMLADRHCARGQGHYFGRPLDIEDTLDVLAQQAMGAELTLAHLGGGRLDVLDNRQVTAA